MWKDIQVKRQVIEEYMKREHFYVHKKKVWKRILTINNDHG